MPRESGFADLNGARLAYEVTGSGSPLVLIHGFSLDARMWEAQVGPFSAEHRVLRYDLRGFGRSPPPTGGTYTDVGDLGALLSHVGMERVHVLGISFGGQVALNFALASPRRTRSLVMADPVLGGFAWSSDWIGRVRDIVTAARTSGPEAAKRLWLADPLFAPARENPSAAAPLERMIAEYSGWHWTHDVTAPSTGAPAADRLADVESPALVLVGERDLPDFQGIADLLARKVRGAQLVRIPAAGHLVNLEAPDAFNAEVIRFLRTVDAGRD